MSRILVVHADRAAKKFLEARAGMHHEAAGVENLAAAMKSISSFRPDLLIAALEVKKKDEAFDLLRYLKRNRIDVAVVLVGGAGAGVLQTEAMRLGASAFVEYPMEQAALDQAISKALQRDKDAHGGVPPVSNEESGSNISDLEKQLNRRMVCFAGKNQVYLQSLILGNGQTSKPRIALKCPLRKQFGHPVNVYYEYIRDVCCGDPTVCPAYQEFTSRHSM